MPNPVALSLVWYEALYYIYINIESKLYNNNGEIRRIYEHTQPVWGKLFMVFECWYSPSRSLAFASYPIPDMKVPYIPASLKVSLFTLLPYTTNIGLIKYFRGNTCGYR